MVLMSKARVQMFSAENPEELLEKRNCLASEVFQEGFPYEPQQDSILEPLATKSKAIATRPQESLDI